MSEVIARISAALYRLLLLRYPRTLRHRHGAAMVELFERQVREAVQEDGVFGVARVWGVALAEALRPLPRLPAPPPTTGPSDPEAPSRAGRTEAGGWLRDWGDDVRFALRSLRREPGFTGTLIGLLAVGVALNAAAFAVVHAYLLRPLPYPAAERVVQARAPVEIRFEDAEGLFEKRVSWDLDAFTLVGTAGSELARGAWVTPDFLDVYGVEPVLGRRFREDEGRPGAAASVAIISHRLWQRRFGGDPRVLGRSVRAYTSDRPDDAESFAIVGVLPPDFWHFNAYTDILAPLRERRALYAGRLLPGVTPEHAADELTERIRARSTGLPDGFRVQVASSHALYVASLRPTLIALQAATLLVLLITCGNAAVLILVRSVRRERELGVRRALGAEGGRLARQLVVEGLVPALLAGLLGVVLAGLALDLVRGLEALTAWRGVPGGADTLRVDGVVLSATVGLCALTGFFFGLVPLVATSRRDLASSLASGKRGGGDTRSRRRLRTLVLGAEVALSLALLTGAGLLIRSAHNLQNEDFGFDPTRVTRGQVGLRQASYPDASERVALFAELVERIRRLPAVEDAGLVGAAPFTWSFNAFPVEAEAGRTAEGVYQIADAGFFTTFDVELLQGRLFEPDEAAAASAVAVVSETLAEALWPDGDPIGRRIRDPSPDGGLVGSGEPGPWHTVVGVVRDVRKAIDGSTAGDLYVNHASAAPFWANVVVKRRAGTPLPGPAVERIVAELDPEAPFATVQQMEEIVERAVAPSRFLAVLFAAFAAFAVVLAVLGLYSVTSFVTRQGRRSVAIRMALGADRGSVSRMFLRQGLAVIGVGLAAGSVGGVRLGRALREELHGVDPFDPWTLGVLGALLGVAAMLAVWLPAREAAGAAPASILREE